MTNPARDLAAAGTGPWQVCRTQYGPSIEDAADGGQVFIESYGITYPADPADAEKAARAVNALPAIADHADAVEQYRSHRRGHGIGLGCGECYTLLSAFFTTWDAVAAALTGETP